MVEVAKSWIKENSTLIYFLIGQLIVIGTAGAGFLSYMVKLETRVTIMETRGAAFSVARMDNMEKRLTVIEATIEHNADAIKQNTSRTDRIVEIMTRELGRKP